MRRVIILGFLAGCFSGYAAPGIMNYQAKLTDSGGLPISNPVTVTFTFWDAASGGNQLGDGFSDVDIVQPSSSGVVSTDIGDEPGVGIPASIFASDSVWLAVQINGIDLDPRTRIAASGYALNAFSLFGPAYRVVEVTDCETSNGLNLIAAYDQAKSLIPHGKPLSATNRAVVLLPPGNYDMGTGQLLMNTEFVDVIGISSARDDQYIQGLTSGPGTGVLRQIANDVRIENLSVECTRSSGGIDLTSSGLAAYFPDDFSTGTVVRNCRFTADDLNALSMRTGITYAGTFENCIGDAHAFGGFLGTASGTFKDCTGGPNAFGGHQGVASGAFTNCLGGDAAFGGFGTASGTFDHCFGGELSFGYGPSPHVASGTFKDCTGGLSSFGGRGNASGNFTNCSGGDESFGGYMGTASGTFTHCTGGEESFGGRGTASGTFEDCTGTTHALGGSGGTASGTFTNCKGGVDAFGGYHGITSGMFTNCVGGAESFGGSYGTASGKFIGCRGDSYAFGGNHGTASGTFNDCVGGSGSFGGALGVANGTFSNCTGGYQAFGGGDGAASGMFTNCNGGNMSFGGSFGILDSVTSGTFSNCIGGDGAFGSGGSAAGGKFYHCVGGFASFTNSGLPVVLYCIRDGATYP